MNLAIPRKDNKEMVLYIWKIIGFPKISREDLLFKLSFDLSIFSPKEAANFIAKSLDHKLILEDPHKDLRISPDLEKQLIIWQKKRKDEIINKIELNRTQTQLKTAFEKDSNSKFNVLLKAFLDKGTLNRAVTVSEASINLITFDFDKGFLKAKIRGTKPDPYTVEIDIKAKILKHDCQDFQTKRSLNKKFCKHLAKLFLILKDKNEKSTIAFLKEISENINEWEFLS